MSAIELAAAILADREKALAGNAGPWPRTQPIPSDLSDCQRQMVLAITNWQDRPAFDPFVKARLNRGNLIEDAVIHELEKLGYRVRVDRVPFELRDQKNRVVLRGKVDGFIQPAGRAKPIPFEAKQMNPNVWAALNTIEDFQRFWYTKRYPLQLQTYLFGNDLEEGLFILDDGAGHWKIIPVPLNWEVVSNIVGRCEEAVETVEALRALYPFPLLDDAQQSAILPPYHPDPAVCRRCWALNRCCFPPLHLPGMQAIGDAETIQRVERWHATKDAHREHEALDQWKRERFRGIEMALVGDSVVRGKETIQQRKAQEAKTIKGWRVEIERLEGVSEEP